MTKTQVFSVPSLLRKPWTFSGSSNEQLSISTKKAFSVLYKTIIRPHLENCIQAWNPGMNKDIHTLEKIQRRATKLVPSFRHFFLPRNLDKKEKTTRRHDRNIKILGGFNKIDADRFFKFPSTIETRGHNIKLFKTGLKKALRCRQELSPNEWSTHGTVSLHLWSVPYLSIPSRLSSITFGRDMGSKRLLKPHQISH